MSAGLLADTLVRRGMSITRVRKAVQTVAFIIPAAALLVLANPGISTTTAVACLTIALGTTSLGDPPISANNDTTRLLRCYICSWVPHQYPVPLSSCSFDMEMCLGSLLLACYPWECLILTIPDHVPYIWPGMVHMIPTDLAGNDTINLSLMVCVECCRASRLCGKHGRHCPWQRWSDVWAVQHVWLLVWHFGRVHCWLCGGADRLLQPHLQDDCSFICPWNTNMEPILYRKRCV